MNTKRLIERWLPIAEVGIESVRERTPMTPFPAPNRLHVWWARRPLVASRAAVLASILPEDADREKFLKAMGIHGDPVSSAKRIALARQKGERFEGQAYDYPRAFGYNPKPTDVALSGALSEFVILDPTAGGGAIPLEAKRLGFSAIGNDLNPVATLLELATIEYPAKYGKSLSEAYRDVVSRFVSLREKSLIGIYPGDDPSVIDTNYLWARTITCPYCAGKVPLSPNWRLGPDGTGVRFITHTGSGPGDEHRHCTFEIVTRSDQEPEGTVAGGDGACPFPDCGRAISGDEIKRQAQAGQMGDQIFAIVYKRQTISKTKSGKNKITWVRGYRAPTAEDNNEVAIAETLAEKLPEWEAMDIVPNEAYPEISNDDRPNQYGMPLWRDMFSPRQLLAHGYGVEAFREMVEEERAAGTLNGARAAAYIYLALGLDKLRDYNSRMTRWIVNREATANTFDRHDFAFKWSYSEMPLSVRLTEKDWALNQVGKCIDELIAMVGPENRGDLLDTAEPKKGSITITNGSGASMPYIADKSVDAVVMDPPYGANVMYAELSDFFYVWLKRTAGVIVPELFTRRLADKDAEAVANKAHFKGQKGMARLADDDYRVKMEGIFAECRRVLKDDGIMTVMFTHKDTGAWDALALSLMDAGFVITASWPVNTEASGSLHIKDKAAANSTIFLVCRPREETHSETMYWEDVEPEVARAVRSRVGEFQAAGIQGVDLYLASFGPALEAFSRHWPLTRGTPAPEPKKKRRTQGDMFDVFDPYAVRPEDALNAARREVKAWRLAQLASAKAQADMDGPTAFYVLAWDAFKAVSFPYDEALRLARAVGVDLETQVIGRLAEKKAAEIKLWDSATRIAKGAIGAADGSRGMIDALHHAAHVMRTRGAEATQEMLQDAGVAQEDEFKVAMEALLEVLPPSKTFSGIDADKAVKPAADDFDALEKLRRIAYEGEIGEPQQLELYRELMVAE
jgi:adenine-specific DNA methylase